MCRARCWCPARWTWAAGRPARRAPPRPRAADPLRILHAPTDREIKGTRYVLAAVERLKAAGYPVALQVLEGIPYAEVPAFVATADIVVDQLMIGAYGTFAVEAMATGRPVVCRIRDDLRAALSRRPAHRRRRPRHDLLRAGAARARPGRTRRAAAGPAPAYVAQVHEMHRVAEQVLPYYGN